MANTPLKNGGVPDGPKSLHPVADPIHPPSAAAPLSAGESNAALFAERRRAPRFKCEGSVEFPSDEGTVRTWGMVTDISRSGCYVEVHGTFPVNAPLVLAIEVGGFRVEAKGTVRTSYPMLGMGINFTEIANVDRGRLEALLHRLASEDLPLDAPGPASPAAPDFSIVIDPTTALTALSHFFHNSPAMTREQFREIISTSQR